MPVIAGDMDLFELKERAREAAELAREAARSVDVDVDVRVEMQNAMVAASKAFNFAGLSGTAMFAQAGPNPRPPGSKEATTIYNMDRGRGKGDSEERLYRRGQEYLDKREWEKAADEFDKAIEKKGTKADGAYYWKAYANSKLGRRDQAMGALAELKKSFPSSRWLNDAKALEAEVQQAGGQAPSPESQSDEDLKLFAINSLMNSDPERALPLLEKILQKSTSPRLRERALFVLAQNRNPKSNEIVVQFARGGGNPDLQQKAVEYLGVYGGKDNLQVLGEIYGSSNDPGLKRGILRSFMVGRDKDRLLNAAKSEQNPELRREAIQYLGSMNAYTELAQLYSGEQQIEARESIIHALGNANMSDKLIEIAKTEKEPRLRSAAIHRLGTMSRSKTSEALVSLYGPETDRGVKEQILNALFVQGSAKEIVEVARKESDISLKQRAVQRLSTMNSKEGTDYLIELINK